MPFSHHSRSSADAVPPVGANKDNSDDPTETSIIVTTHGTISNVNRLISPPSDASTKKRRVTTSTVTPESGKKTVHNVYGTGPPRPHLTPVHDKNATVPPRPVLHTPKNVQIINQREEDLEYATRTVQFTNNTNRDEKNGKEPPSIPTSSLYLVPGSYDANVVKEKLDAHRQEQYEFIIWDPRGWDEAFFATNPMPPSFCQHCRCPPLKCHAKLFGRFCQLHVVNDLYQMADQMSLRQAKQLFAEKYNLALQLKIVEETGQLDVKDDGYELPKCVVEMSLNESLDYVIGFRYHERMHNGIVVGQGRPLNGHNKIFQHAMNDSEPDSRVTVSSTSTTKRTVSFADTAQYAKKKDLTDSIKPPANAFYPLPGTSDAKVVQEIMEAYKDEHYEYIIWDPRGWSAKGNTPMPTSFCPHCRCPPLKCHAQLFGRYCQLHVVNKLYQMDEPINLIQARELYRDQ
jgi:hypothetical protein